MDQLTQIRLFIDRIRLSEGDAFECDEEVVLKAYQDQKDNKSSLPIKILSILGGFLATLTFLAFVGIGGLFNSEFGLLLFGIGFIIVAIGINKKYDRILIDTFSLSLYVSGYALLVIGLNGLDVNDNLIALLLGGIAVCSLIITQGYMLSFISVLVVSGSMLSLILINESYLFIHVYIGIYTLALTYLFLNEAKLLSFSTVSNKLYFPMRIGFMFSLLMGLIAIGKSGIIPISGNQIWLSSILMLLTGIYLMSLLSKSIGIESRKSRVLIYSLSILVLISTVLSPAISGAIIIILLSFLVNYKTGLVIGLIAFIYFICQYYYDLNFSLLTKSILLFSSGILFLLLYVFTSKKLMPNEKI